MINLAAAAVFFLLLHWLVSGTRLRAGLVGRLGEGPYMGLFSLASVAGLAWLIFAYGQARGSAANVFWWGATPELKWVQLALQLVAVLLIVVGLLTPNPTSVKQEGAVARPVGGVLRITRHPFLWGVAVWAAGHLLVNGDLASLLLFGSLLVLALVGPPSIDGKRAHALGPQWTPFAGQTSAVPFAAIAAGRQSLGAAVREIGWWRPLLALAAYFGLLALHPIAFGVSPLP